MTSPTEVSIVELLRQAKQLGLVWGFRPAQVISVSDAFTQFDVSIRYDGDVESIPASSICGPLFENDRVMVLYVPPNGNYVVGPINDPGLGQVVNEVNTSNTALTGVYQLILSGTFNNTSPEKLYQVIYYDRVTGTGGGLARVKATWNPGGTPSASGATIGQEHQTSVGGASNAASPIFPYIVDQAANMNVGLITVGVYALLSAGTSAGIGTAARLVVNRIGIVH